MELAQTYLNALGTQDEVEAEQFSDLYGPAAVANVRRDMASLNQARQNAATMWWRAAMNIEDSAKAQLNGQDGPGISSDEIVQEYDESDRDGNTANGLQSIVDSELNQLLRKLDRDWRSAKSKFAELAQ